MKRSLQSIALCLTAISLSACSFGSSDPAALETTAPGETAEVPSAAASDPVALYSTIDPETLAVSLNKDNNITVSLAQNSVAADNLIQTDEQWTWEYPDQNFAVSMTQFEDYLDVEFQYSGDPAQEPELVWPVVAAEQYTLPLWEGKQFAADDAVWTEYFSGKEMELIENFSMPFLSAGYGDQAVVYIFPDNFNNTVSFAESGPVSFSVRHTFPSVSDDKSYHVRVYVTDNNPAAIAGVYKNYLEANGGIKTLEDKAAENPNIRKLYGAPQIYLFDETVLSAEDVNWNMFHEVQNSAVIDWIRTWAAENDASLAEVLSELSSPEPVNNYQKQTIAQGISRLLMTPEFHLAEVFHDADGSDSSDTTSNPSQDGLTRAAEIARNKQLLYDSLPGVFKPVDTWADSRTTDLLKSMSEHGISHAWIGLNNWEQAYIKPEMVDYAVSQDWLVAPYDSYHSVHAPGQEQWATAAFPADAYESKSVQNKDGSYAEGFQGVGRKLNPTLSLPYVQERLDQILANDISFNSWFVDCDATGEVYNDYSAEHPSSMQEDVAARLERMNVIARDYQMVVGSEGGNDFAANTIAFAHGIELPSFSWMDDDMKANKDSEYYLGRWYAADGGVPEKFGKPVPVKEQYRLLFLNPAYNVPLYKLVYNNAVITTYHWDWQTLKIAGEENNRMLYEMLYNVPPMYHLDQSVWAEKGDEIAAHVKEWSDWSNQVITKNMTDFQVLSDDWLVQMTEFEDQAIVANFSDQPFDYFGQTVEAGGYLIVNK